MFARGWCRMEGIMKRVIVVSLLWVCAALGQELKAPQFLDAQEVMRAAAEVTPEAYPNADTVLVDDLVHEVYRSDGTSASWDDEYTKILTEKGRQDAGVRRFHFATAYGTATVVRAEIFKRDGRTVAVDVAAQSRVMVEPGQMSSNIYDPNNKVLQLTVPGLEVGDVLHVLSTRTTHKPRVPDFWGDYSVFEYTDPIRRLVYEVVAPEGLALRHKVLRDPVAGTVTATREGDLLRWEVRDVPRMFEEPNMPPLHTVVQRLLLSTAEDWPAISRWYWKLSEPRLAATTPEMTNAVARLTAEAKTEMEKVRALFKFVSQEIRYMGIMAEDTAPGYEPHDVSLTFENKYGVCRDKAALLAAMLRIAGIEGYPVLIHAGARLDPDVPLPYFNHAITAAKVNGEYVLMDSTDENTADLLPSYLCRKSYLVAHPQGQPLRVSPVNPVEENLVEIQTLGSVDTDGTLVIKSELNFRGINDNVYRGYFLRNKPADRKKLFEAILKASLPGAEVLEFTLEPEDLQDTSAPLSISVSARAQDWPIRGTDNMTAANLPWLGRSVGYVNWLLGTTGLEERKYPYETEIACGVEEKIEIDASAVFGAAVDLPKPLEVNAPELFFTLAMNMTDGKLTGEYAYKMRETVFSPEQYQTLRANLQDIEYALKQRPLFQAKQDSGADIRVLNASTLIELESRNAWTTTRDSTVQILTYAGKKKNSEISVSYNPVWQTAEIVSATVSNLNGAVFTLSPKELNEMDAPWVASAPDYPAGKTLVASLPGVEIGSVIRTVVKTTQKDAPFFSHVQVFGGFDPMDETSLKVHVPETLTSREWANGGVFREADMDRWSCSNLSALRKEDGLPALRTLLPTVALTTEENWNAYSKTLRNAIDPLIKPSKTIREHARKIAAPFKMRDAKIKALRDDVLQNIRVAGPAFTELPLSTLSSPDKTLARGYGHALDRMILMNAMLHAEDFSTELLFVEGRKSTEGERPWSLRETPQRGEFTMPLIAVLPERSLWQRLVGATDTGDIIYVGDGDQYTPLGVTAFAGCLALNPRTGGICDVGVSWNLKDQTRSLTVINLQPNGDAIITCTNWYFGTACAPFRKHYIEQPPEERRREHLELINGFSRGAEPLSPLVTETEVYPGYTAFSLRAPRFAALTGDTMTVLLPPPPALPLPLRSDRRYNPLLVPEILDDNKTVRVILPEGFTKRIATPSALTYDVRYASPGLGFAYYSSADTTTKGFRQIIDFCYGLSARDKLLGPMTYPLLLEINRKLTHPSQRTIILMKDQE